MDFVTKALGSFGGLPFTLGDRLELDPTFPQLYEAYSAVLKKNSAPCSVFVYDCPNPDRTKLANHALNGLKRFRIPGVLKFIDTVESGSKVYVVTEPVKSLSQVLSELKPGARKWLLHSVLETLGNLHSLQCEHRNVSAGSIFQGETGNWVLGGFEIASFDGNASLATAPLLPSAHVLMPAEGWSSAKEVDTYEFGVLLKYLLPSASRLIQTLTAAKRPSISKLVGSTALNSVLKSSVIEVAQLTPQCVLMQEHEFRSFLTLIRDCSKELPAQFIYGSLLPHLVKRGVTGGLESITLILTLASGTLTETQFNSPFPSEEISVASFLIQLFASLDRAIRLELLRLMPEYMPLVPAKVVQTQILPALTTSFVDTEVRLRKASIESIKTFIPKLTDRQRNGDLLRLLARSHNDVDPAMRALTITTLCEISPQLESRSTVVATALGKSLKDVSAEVRTAALKGVQETASSLPAKELAEKLVGPTAVGILDKDESVATEAIQVLDVLVAKVKAAAGHLSQAPSRSGSVAPPPSSSPSASATPPTPSSAPSQLFGAGSYSQPAKNKSTFGAVSLASSKKTSSAMPPPQARVPRSPDLNHHDASDDDLEDLEGLEDDGWGWGDEPDTSNGHENHNQKNDDDDDAWGW